METVIAISPESGPLYRDFFQSEVLPASYNEAKIHIVQPVSNLASIGVDYLKASEEGLVAAFDLGKKSGDDFLKSFQQKSAV